MEAGGLAGSMKISGDWVRLVRLFGRLLARNSKRLVGSEFRASIGERVREKPFNQFS
jgi:hypothetical protein